MEREEVVAVAGKAASIPRKKRGAQKGPGIVAMIALGVEMTNEQSVVALTRLY